MPTVSTSEAKNQLSDLIRKTALGEEVVVERRGKPVAVILSYQEYTELRELREQARRQQVLDKLRALSREIQQRNNDLTEAEVEALADELSNEAVEGLMDRGTFKYEDR